jgi:hypothetical protein
MALPNASTTVPSCSIDICFTIPYSFKYLLLSYLLQSLPHLDSFSGCKSKNSFPIGGDFCQIFHSHRFAFLLYLCFGEPSEGSEGFPKVGSALLKWAKDF